MIVALDTSTPECRLYLINGTEQESITWNARRDLADGLIGFIRRSLQDNGLGWTDITGFAVYKGPGSFTGLRIGLTVLNTAADSLGIPIAGETGDDWLDAAIQRLESGDNDKLVMPLYGREPNITTPRK